MLLRSMDTEHCGIVVLEGSNSGDCDSNMGGWVCSAAMCV